MNVRNWSKKSSGLTEWKWLYGVDKLRTIGQLLKLNWLYTELGDFLPVHYTPIFTPQTVGGFINNILAHHD